MKAILAALALGLSASGALAASAPAIEATLAIHADKPGDKIDRHIFGQFAEHLGTGIYGGVWVGEKSPIPNIHGYRKDVVDALKAIKVPVIRWPGGCFADEYHWRDGIGPRDQRPVRVNNIWGGVEETNAFGTHEFFDFAELVGADTYLSVNLGTGSPAEMKDWIEYITSPTHSALADLRRKNGRDKPWRIDYLAVGNEAWGCGGHMRSSYYLDEYRRYQEFIRSPQQPHIFKVASGANSFDFSWTDTIYKDALELLDGISVHYYTLPTDDWSKKGPSMGFGEDQYISTLQHALRMDQVVAGHSKVMDKYDPKKRTALFVDEWGVWTDSEPGTKGAFLHQQDSLRNAIAAALHFDIFIAHADRVRMANISQMINVLQPMALTDGPKMVLTPTYWVFMMYKPFQDATLIPTDLKAKPYTFGGVDVPSVHTAVARDAAGVLHVALVNLDPNRAADVSGKIDGAAVRSVSGQVLTAAAFDAVNTFDKPDTVTPAAFDGASIAGNALTVHLPPKSIVVLDVR
jgi:alpha-L-arabinofuranosidase